MSRFIGAHVRIADMNWMQVEDYLRRDDRAVLPLGSTEQHSYLRLTVDCILPERVDALVAHNRRSAKSHSGVWRDLAVRKRPTEIDAQLGVAVTLGAEAGVPTPLTARLIDLIHEIEGGQRSQSLDALDALAATPIGAHHA